MSNRLQQLALDRLFHRQVVDRLTARVYDQPIIGNVERGVYVECMVELAMHSVDPRWSLTATWDAWDLEHEASRARIEVKQSSCLQTWAPDKPSAGSATPTFDVAPREGYWDVDADGATVWLATGLMRHADVYIFAWHGNCDQAFADQRRAEQWEFYVVASDDLPEAQKTISLGPLQKLAGDPVRFDDLAERITSTIESLQSLRTNQLHA